MIYIFLFFLAIWFFRKSVLIYLFRKLGLGIYAIGDKIQKHDDDKLQKEFEAKQKAFEAFQRKKTEEAEEFKPKNMYERRYNKRKYMPRNKDV